MPKTGKDSNALATGPPTLQNKDLYQRINFSYQASIFLQQLAVAGPSTESQDVEISISRLTDRKGKRRVVEAADETGALGRLARRGLAGTKKLAVHNLLKL